MLNNKAEHVKVKVRQEDTLHSKCSLSNILSIVIALRLYYHAGL